MNPGRSSLLDDPRFTLYGLVATLVIIVLTMPGDGNPHMWAVAWTFVWLARRDHRQKLEDAP